MNLSSSSSVRRHPPPAPIRTTHSSTTSSPTSIWYPVSRRQSHRSPSPSSSSIPALSSPASSHFAPSSSPPDSPLRSSGIPISKLVWPSSPTKTFRKPPLARIRRPEDEGGLMLLLRALEEDAAMLDSKSAQVNDVDDVQIHIDDEHDDPMTANNDSAHIELRLYSRTDLSPAATNMTIPGDVGDIVDVERISPPASPAAASGPTRARSHSPNHSSSADKLSLARAIDASDMDVGTNTTIPADSTSQSPLYSTRPLREVSVKSTAVDVDEIVGASPEITIAPIPQLFVSPRQDIVPETCSLGQQIAPISITSEPVTPPSLVLDDVPNVNVIPEHISHSRVNSQSPIETASPMRLANPETSFCKLQSPVPRVQGEDPPSSESPQTFVPVSDSTSDTHPLVKAATLNDAADNRTHCVGPEPVPVRISTTEVELNVASSSSSHETTLQNHEQSVLEDRDVTMTVVSGSSLTTCDAGTDVHDSVAALAPKTNSVTRLTSPDRIQESIDFTIGGPSVPHVFPALYTTGLGESSSAPGPESSKSARQTQSTIPIPKRPRKRQRRVSDLENIDAFSASGTDGSSSSSSTTVVAIATDGIISTVSDKHIPTKRAKVEKKIAPIEIDVPPLKLEEQEPDLAIPVPKRARITKSRKPRKLASSSTSKSVSVRIPSPSVADALCSARGIDMSALLVDVLVFGMGRLSSTGAPDLTRALLRDHPALLLPIPNLDRTVSSIEDVDIMVAADTEGEIETAIEQREAEWLGVVRSVLYRHPVFGRVERRGLDADGNKLEDTWFYQAEMDPDRSRAETLADLAPKRRSAKMGDRTYFYAPIDMNRWVVAAELEDDD